jgi:hypothetical protein
MNFVIILRNPLNSGVFFFAADGGKENAFGGKNGLKERGKANGMGEIREAQEGKTNMEAAKSNTPTTTPTSTSCT